MWMDGTEGARFWLGVLNEISSRREPRSACNTQAPNPDSSPRLAQRGKVLHRPRGGHRTAPARRPQHPAALQSRRHRPTIALNASSASALARNMPRPMCAPFPNCLCVNSDLSGLNVSGSSWKFGSLPTNRCGSVIEVPFGKITSRSGVRMSSSAWLMSTTPC